jgi:hypothetical protein
MKSQQHTFPKEGGTMESLDFNEEEAVQDGGEELEEEDTDAFDEAVEEERARTDETTALPTELAGGGSSDVPGHDAGPAEL